MHYWRYAVFTIDGEQVFLTLDTLQTTADLLWARAKLQCGSSEEAENIVKRLKGSIPEAKYIWAATRISRTERPLEADLMELQNAANMGYPTALYQVGAYHDMGEYFCQDKNMAFSYFLDAAKMGHAHSMWLYGTYLAYSNGEHNRQEGMEWIKKSADLKFVEALETLARWNDAGEFGFPRSPAVAAELRRAKADLDAIRL